MQAYEKKINFVLISLAVLDVLLSTVCLFFPEWWTTIMHGAVYADPLGMIRRLGAVWAAFVLFQLIAVFRWKQNPHWLVIVAGIRWTEVFSDWFYWYFAETLTLFGHAGLLIAPPVNLMLGLFLLKMFSQLSSPKPVT